MDHRHNGGTIQQFLGEIIFCSGPIWPHDCAQRYDAKDEASLLKNADAKNPIEFSTLNPLRRNALMLNFTYFQRDFFFMATISLNFQLYTLKMLTGFLTINFKKWPKLTIIDHNGGVSMSTRKTPKALCYRV